MICVQGKTFMKRIPPFLSILILVTLGACTLRAPGAKAPTAFVSATEAPAVAVPTEVAAPTLLPATAEVVSSPTVAAPVAVAPTPYPLPDTPAPQPDASQPTATQPAPTATATPVITFDPYTAYGKPKYQNKMEFPALWEWKSPEEEELPNNNRIRLRFVDGELHVTGKRTGFSTWWFSGHGLSDAFIEMTFDTLDCSGEDAYGIIFRGPPHEAGESYGYVVSFTCNGKLWAYRLDAADPFEAETLIDEEKTSAINSGADEENVIGIRAEGDKFVIFANGTQVAEVEDDEFEKGRVGVFVRAASPNAYTYKVTNFAYWILGE
jgi:hypothetical protein